MVLSSYVPARLRPWVQVAEIAWAAPQVIAYRTFRMAVGGWPPSARDRREYTRMVREKAEALAEVTVAVAKAPVTGSAAFGAAVAPVHRRVVANQRRLAKGLATG